MRASERIHRGLLRESIAENIEDMADEVHGELEDSEAADVLYEAEDDMDDLAHGDLAPGSSRRDDDEWWNPFTGW